MAIMTKGQGVIRLTKTLIILACCLANFTLEIKAAPIVSETGVVNYLSRFGYLPPVNPKSEAIISKKTLSKAISEFQSFFGINVTGILDVETTQQMSLPRCGVKDKVASRESNRTRRWVIRGSQWEKRSLTYKINRYPSRIDRTTVDREIARAFAVWSEYTDLTFTPKRGLVDIEIGFVRGYHGDDNPFNGPYSTELAHAFYPDAGGDAHFDDDKHWTINSYEGYNLFQVAAHEFGHSLGLMHSENSLALMAPTYRSYEPNFQLHTDDVQGIQAIYGPKTRDEGFGPRRRSGGHFPRTRYGGFWSWK